MQRLLNLLVGVGLVISALAMFAVSARLSYLGVQDASALGVVFLGVVPVVAGLLTLAALHLSHGSRVVPIDFVCCHLCRILRR